jgi:signal transduction histidine kinase
MGPNMIMHPYRRDLEGKDVSEFQDSAGKKMFQEIVETVRADGSGYVDYLWQWKGDAQKIVPKISYVKEFKPWEWIVGTGIYVNDVEHEIKTITRQVIYTCSGIMLLFLILSGYIIWQGAKAEKEREKAIEQSRLRGKQLIQADKMTSLGILVAGVAHEINNPATSLMLNAPNLKKAWKEFTPIMDDHFARHKNTLVCNMPYEKLSERIQMMLDGIEDSAARIKGIITELKDFSRPTAADTEEDVDINEVIKKSLDLTHSITKKATENLMFKPEPELPQIFGNAQKLQQVMINLIVNASQALENKKQSIHIETSKDLKDSMVVVEVSDTGPGVPPEQLDKLRDPFFTTKRDDGGTGLGLSISEKIIYDHKGLMEFSSEPGKGLTVKILLPFFTENKDTVPG